MRTRLLFWDEDKVRKKKTLILVLVLLLIPLLLGLYAATGPEGGLIAEVTPTALTSPVATVTPHVPTFTATATPSATATAEATATPLPTPTPVRPEPTVAPTAVPVTLEPTPTPTVVPIAAVAAPIITTLPDGSVLKDNRPIIAGAAPPNTTVQVYDDGSLVGTAAADAQGDWALVVDEPLEPGEHTLTAVASDDAGRMSAPSVAVTFTFATERLPVTGSSSFEGNNWCIVLFGLAFFLAISGFLRSGSRKR
jgi:hypothetical protein